MTRTKAARHRCNDNRANVHFRRDSHIIPTERAELIGGIIIAVAFGLMFVYAAVMF